MTRKAVEEGGKKNPNHSGLLRILLGYKIVHFQVSVEKLASCNAGGT